MTISAIGAYQASATENTLHEINKLLDYCATYLSDGITYRASNMVLAAHLDASFLSESKSRSRAGGHIFLSEDDPLPRNNGPLLSISRVMKHVCPSAAEAETGALFIVAQEMVPLRNMLTEMGWPQTTLTNTNGQLHRQWLRQQHNHCQTSQIRRNETRLA
jgi:hypothetical protein